MKTPRKCAVCHTAYAILIKAKLIDQSGAIKLTDDLNEMCPACFVARVFNRRMGMNIELSLENFQKAKKPASYEVLNDT